MVIPMTVRANYMVDGVPHARVVHHLPHRRPVRRGKRTPQTCSPKWVTPRSRGPASGELRNGLGRDPTPDVTPDKFPVRDDWWHVGSDALKASPDVRFRGES